MKQFLLFTFCLCTMQSFSQGTDRIVPAGNVTVTREIPIGSPSARVEAVDPNSYYSNVTTYGGNIFSNGGAAVVGSNTITRLVADQLTLVGTPPFTIGSFQFSVSNTNPTAVTARARVRFYEDNGGGAPGTFIAGYTLPARSYAANVAQIYNSGPVTPFVIPGQTVWAGITFDNADGTTGATAAQLNNLGQAVFNPIDRGSSTDLYFITSTAGEFGASNPAGSTANFGGTPPANFAWELIAGSTMPIHVEYFKGAKMGSAHNLEWKINCVNTPGGTIEVERSGDGRNYTAINSRNVTLAQCSQPFSYSDLTPLAGVNYYRIKTTDANGKIIYSNTLALLNKQKGFELININPNPVKTIATINIASAESVKVQVRITNVEGRQVYVRWIQLSTGSNLIPLDLSSISQGGYQLTLEGSSGNKQTVRFIKY